ncbi:MAG: hypothetical protein D6705_08885 [Deltaproteobacteria bacterium]|nr:MAG: hypothetical protein D6705_08885 [Deltaproteobacteria bacterium]
MIGLDDVYVRHGSHRRSSTSTPSWPCATEGALARVVSDDAAGSVLVRRASGERGPEDDAVCIGNEGLRECARCRAERSVPRRVRLGGRRRARRCTRHGGQPTRVGGELDVHPRHRWVLGARAAFQRRRQSIVTPDQGRRVEVYGVQSYGSYGYRGGLDPSTIPQ